VFSRSYPYSPIAVTEQMRDGAMASFDSTVQVRRGERSAPLRARIRELLPSALPPVPGLVVGRDGTIWVQRNTGAGKPPEFLVLSATGDVVGLVRARSVTMGVREVTRSHAWVSDRDGDGFVSVVRFRPAYPTRHSRGQDRPVKAAVDLRSNAGPPDQPVHASARDKGRVVAEHAQ
jgi:hypothetical protein